MGKPNSGKVNHSLGQIIKVAPNLTSDQKAAIKPIVDEIREMEDDPNVSNLEIHMFASAALVLGRSLMRYTEGLGNPHSTARSVDDAKYATEVLVGAGLQTNRTKKQKFKVPPDEPPDEPPADVPPPPEPPAKPPAKAPAKRRKTRAKPRPRS